MGNLSCVSCKANQHKTKKKSTGQSRPDDVTTAAPADAKDVRPDVIADVGADNDATNGRSPNDDDDAGGPVQHGSKSATAGDVEEPGRQQPGWREIPAEWSPFVETVSKTSDDVEQVAQLIVQMTLFIASQVICPAIERYHAEMDRSGSAVPAFVSAST